MSLSALGLHIEEELGLSGLFKLRGPKKPPSEVVIVSIDKSSAEALQLPEEPEKWPRSLHADLITQLTKSGASLIAFNILFDEGREPDDDLAMAKAMRAARNVILSEYLKQRSLSLTNQAGKAKGSIYYDTLITPIPILEQAALLSSPFPLPKGPSHVKQFWMYKASAGEIPTFPVSVFQCFVLGQAYDELLPIIAQTSPLQAIQLPKDYKELLSQRGVFDLLFRLKAFSAKEPLFLQRLHQALDKADVPPHKRRLLRSWLNTLQDESSRYLNHYGPPGTIPTIPYHKTIRQTEAIKDQIFGKVVFVGYAENLQPEKNLGFYTVFSRSEGLTISTVEIAATAFANFLDDAFVRPLQSPDQVLLMIGWGSLLVLLCRLLPLVHAFIGCLALSAAYLVLAHFQFAQQNLWLPLVIPLGIQAPLVLLIALCQRYIKHTQERENIRKAFSHYVPETMVEKLTGQKTIGDLSQDSQLVCGVCLATDAGKYTTLAESIDPMTLGNLMNEYYGAIFQPVKQHGGLISDVIGDAMLAIWASECIDDALRINACRAALAIKSAVDGFNQGRLLTLPTRIGLHYGVMRLGNVGSVEHYEYRAVGDIVNTATRIEGLNKTLGTRVLASADTLAQLDEFCSREVGTFLLEGKTKALAIHELMGLKTAVPPELHDLAARFTEALELFKAQQWDRALAAFLRLLKDYPGDGPSLFYTRQCRHYRKDSSGQSESPVIKVEKKGSTLATP